MFSYLDPAAVGRARRFMTAALATALVSALVLLAGPTAVSAHGATRTITGTLSKRGYTVIALGYNGKAVISASRRFRIKAPDSRVTLQLRDAHGKYAGPVIVAGGGPKVIEGVRAGAALGMIEVLSGYAKTVRALGARWLDRGRWAQAHRGLPLGNGRNFGLARSTIHNGPSGPGGDTSRTGVPNALSIDPAGDGVIAALRPSRGLAADLAAAAPTGPSAPTGPTGPTGPSGPTGPPTGPTGPPSGPMPPPSGSGSGPSGFSFFSQIFLDLGQTLNADAAGVTTADIDAMLPQFLNIVGTNVPQGDSVALDCGGLTYCSAGGTGQLTASNSPNPTFVPFPSCCDPSGDGFGNLRGPDAVGLGRDNHQNNWAFLYPRATSSQIGSGDAFVLRVTSGGALTESPVSLGFVFNTVPALESYNDLVGDSGTISYPAAAGSPGTQNNPIPVTANSSGDVVLVMRLWRPQRKGIPGAGEPTFMDIGHLLYTIDATNLAQNVAAGASSLGTSSVCSAESLGTRDPALSVSGSGTGLGYVVDRTADQPANPANLIGFGVNLTRCLTDAGAPGFPVGAQGAIGLKAQAPNSGDHAVQNIWVKRVR